MEFSKLKNQLGDEWYNALKDNITDKHLEGIWKVSKEFKTKTIYPPSNLTFRAYRETPFSKVKVVIIGMDPYHDGNATGLCFDCGIKVTPSMRSIIQAYNDYNPSHFDTDILDGKISRWTKEGVMLLNTALSVEKGKAGSHTVYWKAFILKTIQVLSDRKDPIIFLLWGTHAHGLEKFIDNRHHVLKAEHPVACVYQGRKWEHNDHFRVCNTLLERMNKTKINW